MKILSDLYFGNINPNERFIKHGSKVEELVKLISANEEAVSLGESTGVCVTPFREWGYTVMKKDENGNELPEVDWTQTKAIFFFIFI